MCPAGSARAPALPGRSGDMNCSMELTHLRYFFNVAKTKSFVQGARLSHVTPPAISKAIKKLEGELGTALFIRTTRHAALTQSGEILLNHCRDLFRCVENLERALERSRAEVSGDLRIGAMEVFSMYLLPAALCRLTDEHPAVTPMAYEMGPELAVEINRKLAQRARNNLGRLKNVEFVEGDATRIDQPVDVIVVSAGVALLPKKWFSMLRRGGRMVVPMTGSRGHGASFLFARRRDNITARFLMPVGFSSCAGTRDESAAQAVDEAIRAGYKKAAQVKKARLDDHRRDESCWLHTSTVCLNT